MYEVVRIVDIVACVTLDQERVTLGAYETYAEADEFRDRIIERVGEESDTQYVIEPVTEMKRFADLSWCEDMEEL